MLCTETFTQSSVYAQVFLHRGLRTEKLLCTDTFTHRGFYTKKKIFTYRCSIQRCFCAHKQRHVGIFTHRNFATEKPLHRTVFTLRFFGTEKNYTEKIIHADCTKKNTTPIFFTQQLYPEQFSHSRNSFAQKPLRADFFKCTAIITDRWFIHRKFSTQKSYAQKVLRTTVFYIQSFYTQMPLHGRRIADRNLCTQHIFTRNQLLHREVLLPILDHLPFVFPLSSDFYKGRLDCFHSQAYSRYI